MQGTYCIGPRLFRAKGESNGFREMLAKAYTLAIMAPHDALGDRARFLHLQSSLLQRLGSSPSSVEVVEKAAEAGRLRGVIEREGLPEGRGEVVAVGNEGWDRLVCAFMR